MYAVSLNKQINYQKIIFEIDKLIKKNYEENKTTEDLVLVFSIKKTINSE